MGSYLSFFLITSILVFFSFSLFFKNENQHQIEQTRIVKCLKSCLSDCPKQSLLIDLGSNCFSPCFINCYPNKPSNDHLKQRKHEFENYAPYFCTQGINPATVSLKNALKLFSKGPCVPVILVPGVMATKLTIEIDCKVFSQKETKIFQRCGWNACQKNHFQFWLSVPKKEYQLWIPELLSDISILSLFEKSNICFASLIKPHFNPEKPIEQMTSQLDGIKVRVYGFSDGTKIYGKCGNEALQNILPLPIQVSASEGFSELNKALIQAGYLPGLTMQSIPYNFYYSYRHNEFSMSFEYNLVRLGLYTGKKVTIIAHSMGNLNTLYNLSKMKAAEKHRLIHNWVSIGAPLMGSVKAQKLLISGSDEFATFNGIFGFHFAPFIQTVTNQLSLYEICAVNPLKKINNEPFFAALKKRMDYEAYFPDIDFQYSGFPFWPSLNDVCYDRYIENMSITCQMKLPDLDNWPMIKIGETTYRIDDTYELFKAHQLSHSTMTLFKKLVNPDLSMIFPEIPVIVIFMNAIATPMYYEFGSDLDQKIEREEFPMPEKTGYIFGDETVPSYSTLIPSLRWAYNFDHKTEGDLIVHQPVKFVEFCSTYKRYVPVYDEKESDKPFKIKRNGYIGLKCECSDGNRGEDYDQCKHANMHADYYLIQFILSVVKANYVASEEQLLEIENMNEEILRFEIDECTSLRSSIFH